MRTMPLLSSCQFFIPAPCLQIEFEPSCGNKKSPSKMMDLCFWRRLRDSNPRYSYPYTNFPGLLLKPLGQVSYFILNSNFPACSPDSYRDDHSDILLFYSQPKFQFALLKVSRRTIDIHYIKNELWFANKLGLQK